MKNKTTLEELGDMLAHVVKHMATKDDITNLREDMASLHTQVTSIEGQLRGMQHTKLENRVLDLEEEVFGKARG